MLSQPCGKAFLLNVESGKAAVLLWNFIQSQFSSDFKYPTPSTSKTQAKAKRNLTTV